MTIDPAALLWSLLVHLVIFAQAASTLALKLAHPFWHSLPEAI